MPSVVSAAFSILVPLGAVSDDSEYQGSANILADMFNKGAGPWNTQELSERFEEYGVQRSNSSGVEVSAFSGAVLAENLGKALELYATVLLEPSLPAEELESVRQLALQDLRGLEDEPASKAMAALAELYYPEPFGRSSLGTEDGLQKVTADSLREYYETKFVADGTIIALAGNYDWDAMLELIQSLFGKWKGKSTRQEVAAFGDVDKTFHIEKDTSQVQIALATPSVCIDHPHYYTAKIAAGVLSGGMSGRLFIEVREKRGLVYRVSASHSAARDRAAMFASAGTTPENAEETLQVMLTELRKLSDGASDEELQRAKADIKSRLVMQSELSSSRVNGIVNDWFNLGRLRTLDEIKDGIDAVTSSDLSKYAEEYPISPISLVTLGSKPLSIPE